MIEQFFFIHRWDSYTTWVDLKIMSMKKYSRFYCAPVRSLILRCSLMSDPGNSLGRGLTPLKKCSRRMLQSQLTGWFEFCCWYKQFISNRKNMKWTIKISNKLPTKYQKRKTKNKATREKKEAKMLPKKRKKSTENWFTVCFIRSNNVWCRKKK